jgi:hypothetical protein
MSLTLLSGSFWTVCAPPARAHLEMMLGGSSHEHVRAFMLEASIETPESCLVHCARVECFSRFTVPQMLELVDEAGAPHLHGARPKLEADVVECLVRHRLPRAIEEELDEVYGKRKRMKRSPIQAKITPELAALVEEAVPEQDAPTVDEDFGKLFVEKVVRTKVKKRKQPAQAEEQPSQLAPVGQASSSRAGLRQITGTVFNIGQARALMPKGRGTTIAIHTGRAWQVKYAGRVTEGPKSHMETWGPDRSHRLCLLTCLSWAWQRHAEATSETCPWDLGELRP